MKPRQAKDRGRVEPQDAAFVERQEFAPNRILHAVDRTGGMPAGIAFLAVDLVHEFMRIRVVLRHWRRVGREWVEHARPRVHKHAVIRNVPVVAADLFTDQRVGVDVGLPSVVRAIASGRCERERQRPQKRASPAAMNSPRQSSRRRIVPGLRQELAVQAA